MNQIILYFRTPFIDIVNWVEPELIPCLHPFRFLCRVKATCYCYTMNYRGGRSLPRLLLLPGLLLKGYRTGPGRPNDGKPILRRSTPNSMMQHSPTHSFSFSLRIPFSFPFQSRLLGFPYRLVGRVVFRLPTYRHQMALPSQQALNLLRFALPEELKRKRKNSDERKAQDSPITMLGQRERKKDWLTREERGAKSRAFSNKRRGLTGYPYSL